MGILRWTVCVIPCSMVMCQLPFVPCRCLAARWTWARGVAVAVAVVVVVVVVVGGPGVVEGVAGVGA